MWDGDVTSLPEVGVVFPPLIHRFFHFFFPILVSFGLVTPASCPVSFVVCHLVWIYPHTLHIPLAFCSFRLLAFLLFWGFGIGLLF
jgi:hypothetical protein